MIVYLDQNKWIELARIHHGKNRAKPARAILREIKASIECGYQYPLSSCHYMEFSRISNPGRRKRLGKVMWKYSQGFTLASIQEILLSEIEFSLKQFYPKIVPRTVELIGRGVGHAFGEKAGDHLPNWLNVAIEKALLVGDKNKDMDPISRHSTQYRESFRSHLESLHELKKEVGEKKVEDLIYIIILKDIIEPLLEILMSHGLDKELFENFKVGEYTKLVDSMPSRLLDAHLHRQVFRNPNYKPKISDLEDWAGLGLAACHCDIVVCEKHFANMLKRDKFKTKARVVTNLNEIFK